MKHFRIILLSVIAVAVFGSAEALDYHKCSQLLIDIYGQRCVDEACQFIDAFWAGESSVQLTGYQIGDAPIVESLASDMCPILSGTVWLGWDAFDDDTNTLHWTFLFTPEEISDYKTRFENVCASYLSRLQGNESELFGYLSLYYDFTSERAYNNNLQDELNACTRDEDQAYVASALRTMIEYTGTCAEFSTCYTFLCIQAGLNAAGVGDMNAAIGAHEWNVIEIDGKYYYCDTTWDLPDETGYPSLTHFGITAEERSRDGFELADTEFHTNYPLITVESLGLDDERFSYMHGWPYWDITDLAISGDTITVTNIDGQTSEIK